MRAGDLALLEHRHRDLAELLAQLGLVGEQVEEPVRAGEAGRPAADDRDPDLDPLVLGIGRRGDQLAGVEWGWIEGWFDRHRDLAARRSSAPQEPFFAFTASVSFGRILCRSPTTPRSQNSKIGAFGSLLTARMLSELCIPTLCWIAPEMPAAR